VIGTFNNLSQTPEVVHKPHRVSYKNFVGRVCHDINYGMALWRA